MDEKTSKYMERIHDANFDMLCEVDRICRKYDIKYNLHGGTFLGAVRHKDFIPWDDDVDIGFVRAEYERFLEVFEKEAPEHLKLMRPEDYTTFYDFMVKIANTDVTYAATNFGADDFYDGRFLHPTMDLFVYDIKKSNFQLMKLKALYALALGHRPYVNYGHFKGAMKAVAFVLSSVGKMVPFKKIAAWYKKVQVEGGALEMTEGAGLPTVFVSNEQMNPKYWGLTFFGPCVLNGYDTGIIRGREFPVPKLYDRWFSFVYGDDYMSFPPEDKQWPQHVYDLM
ncbi:LicD family protein [Butyrivibrio sp. FCS014]|uniref:LicD family protein n=1 Tax=Butyrivibrio sp. FCS014 TaxID=1408304 RepID=UPI000467307A|nr:LicD family protein [Butyrivibrio sp. FCS014]